MRKARMLQAAFTAVAALGLAGSALHAQSVPAVTGDARVDKLLSQMTLEEKLKLIHGTHEDAAVYPSCHDDLSIKRAILREHGLGPRVFFPLPLKVLPTSVDE